MKLLLHVPARQSATSFYRGFGPFGRLREINKDIDFALTDSYDWAVLSMVDAVYLERPHSANDLVLVKMIKKNQKPLWIDYDDDLMRVPDSNPSKYLYRDIDSIAEICQKADVITVSTEHLRSRLSQHNRNIVVIPNSFDDKKFHYRSLKKRNKIVLWRGSETHQKDLMEYMEVLTELAYAHKDWHWYFLGDPFFALIDRLPKDRVKVQPGVDIIDYHRIIQELAPAIAIVPLYDDEFNRSKSNIAWIEASFAGAATLAPKWDEWEKPGVYNYEDKATFRLYLEDMLSSFDAGDLQAANQMSWHYIQSNLFLSQTNKLRLQILNELVSGHEI